MRSLLAILWCLAAAPAETAVIFPPTRRSEAFVVHDYRLATTRLGNPPRPEGRDLIDLSPDVLLVSAERIREALLKALDVPGAGGDKIHLCLKRAGSGGDGVKLSSTMFVEGWRYRLDVPDRLQGLELLRSVVQVVLLELANRAGGPKRAEIPRWLAEGMTHHLRALVGPDLVVSAVPFGMFSRSVRQIQGADPLVGLREYLRSQPPMSFAELSQWKAEEAAPESRLRFQHSAQFFVHALLQLPSGPALLVQLLRRLPHCWNSEVAFLEAYRPVFGRLLDVEKWWFVNVMALIGRDPTQVLALDISLRKLDDILVSPVLLWSSPAALPERLQVSLQQLISEWEFPIQREVLQHILRQLEGLRRTSPMELIPLIESYRKLLQGYLQARMETASGHGSKGRLPLPAHMVVREAIQKLDQLYLEREVLRRSQMSTAQATAEN